MSGFTTFRKNKKKEDRRTNREFRQPEVEPFGYKGKPGGKGSGKGSSDDDPGMQQDICRYHNERTGGCRNKLQCPFRHAPSLNVPAVRGTGYPECLGRYNWICVPREPRYQWNMVLCLA